MGAVFGIFCGFTYWFGKMFGVQYNKWLAGAHFWAFFIGVNIIFFPQHFLGMQGMPRRYVDYPEEFAYFNQISTFGAFITLFSVFLFFLWVFEALIVRRKVNANTESWAVGATESNYWGEGANTLEWTLPSPPPYHQFNTLPVIKDEGSH